MKKIKKPTKKTLARQIQAAEDRILRLEQEALLRHKEGKALRQTVLGHSDQLANWSERIRQVEVALMEPVMEVHVSAVDPEPSATVSEQIDN